jgi:hypothetical protein
MKDILSNHRIEIIRSVASEAFADAAANKPSNNGYDLWANNQLPNRALIIVDVTSVGTGGTLDLIVQDSQDKSTWDTDFITVTRITATGLYLIDVPDPYRYLRVNHNALTDAVVWGAYMITFEDQRLPVTQSATTCTLTFGSGRKPKVSAT